MPGYPLNDFLKALEPLYAKKDPAHGTAHVRRVHSKAMAFAKGKEVDKTVLALGAALHGFISENKAEATQLLLMTGVPADVLEKGVETATESQADALPQSAEGRLLHDAHLCEGGENFIAVKSLATGSFRGYPLQETYRWVMENIIRNKRRRCYTKEGKKDYAKKFRRLKEIWKELGEIIG